MSGTDGPADAGGPPDRDPPPLEAGDPPFDGDDEALLRRELADLEAFLEEHGGEGRERPLDVDLEVRRRKAEVLREVLDEAPPDGDASGEA